jgi:hypothetical protein
MSVAPEGAWTNSPKVPRVPPPQHVRLFLPREFLALERRMLGTPVPPWATFCRPPKGGFRKEPTPLQKGGGHPKNQDKKHKAPGPRNFLRMRALRAGRGAPWATNSAGKTSGLPPDKAPSGRPELQEPTFRAERERWGTRKSQELQIPGDTPVPPGRRRYEEGKSRTHPSERVGHPKNQHKKHKAFLCAKSAVTLLDARKLLMSMTFARRNGLLAPDNLFRAGGGIARNDSEKPQGPANLFPTACAFAPGAGALGYDRAAVAPADFFRRKKRRDDYADREKVIP